MKQYEKPTFTITLLPEKSVLYGSDTEIKDEA